MAPVATVSLPGAGSVQPLIGEALSINVTFDNTANTADGDPNDTGYGPYVDLFLDTSGVDGYDGLSFVDVNGNNVFGATFLGTPLPYVQAFAITGPTYVHPLTGQTLAVPAGYGVGDTLVVLGLPFGSFTPTQPAAAINVTMATSDLADLNVALNVAAVGGFRFGADPLDNASVDPPLRGAQANSDVTPQLYRLTKVYLGPEDETATGPNHRQRYRIDADIATGQTITGFTISDILAASMQYTGAGPVITRINGVVVPANLIGQPSVDAPGGTLTNLFGTVTGVEGIDASLEFEFFVTRDSSDNPATPVVPQGTDQTTGNNTGNSNGTWDPNDVNDPTISVPINLPPNAHVLNQQSVATQKYVTVVDPLTLLPTSGSITPGTSLLRYDIDFQVSDYFALQNLILQDFLSDGQRLYATAGTMPTLAVNNAYDRNTNTRGNTSGAFTGNGTILYQEFFTTRGTSLSDPTAEPALGGVFAAGAVAGNLGETFVQFNISQELIARLFAGGLLVGGNVPVNGAPVTGDSPTYGELFGGVTGRITFYAEVKSEFSDVFPSGDRSVDQLDILSNRVPLIRGEQIDTTTADGPTGAPLVIGIATDDTASAVQIPIGEPTKEIYAINGQTISLGQVVTVQPGDLVTYRLRYTLPISSFEDVTMTDYLPLPVFPVSSQMYFDPTAAPGTIPSVDTIVRGLSDTYFTTINPFGVTVRTATTAALTGPGLAYNGATPENGQFTNVDRVVDGVTMNVNDYVLVKNQADPRQNGIYRVTAVSGATMTLVRVVEFDSVAEALNSKLFRVLQGAVNIGQIFRQENKLFTVYNGAPGSSSDLRFSQFITTDAVGNSFTLDIGTYDDTASGNRPSVIDLLVTVRVADAAFTENLFLTNQLRVTEGSTNAGTDYFDDIVQFEVVVPELSIDKGVVGHNSTTLPTGGIVFTNPSVAPGFSGTLDTATEAEDIGDSDITDPGTVDANDEVRFAIVVQNSGRGDAYDVVIEDTIPVGFDAPASAADLIDPANGSLTVFRGDGTQLITRQLVDGYVRVATTAIDNLSAFSFTTTGGGQLSFVSLARTVTIDGVTLEVGDRVLVKNRANPAENGIYVVSINHNATNGMTTTTLTRAVDADTGVELSGYVVAVHGGLTQANQFFTATGGAITLNVTGITWTAGGSIPEYYYTYDATTRIFSVSVTDTYTAGNTTAATTDARAGGISRGASGSLYEDPFGPATNTIQSVSNGSNTIVIVYDLRLADDVEPTPDLDPLVNTATVTNSAKSEGGTPNDPISDDASVVVQPIPSKLIDSTSEVSTGVSGGGTTQVTIGEIVRYRLVVQIPEGSSPNLIIRDNLPNGLTFLNDGTSTVVFVSNQNPFASTNPAGSTLGLGLGAGPFGGGLWQIGNQTNIASINPTFALPGNSVGSSNSLTTDANAFGSGNDIFFKLGDVLNSDSDADLEYVVIEFNALVHNESGTFSNDSGDNRDNNFSVFAGGDLLADSNTVRVQVVEPRITVVKDAAPTTGDAGDTVTFTVRYTNSGTATAFEAILTDTLPTDLTLLTIDPPVVSGTVTGYVFSSTANSFAIDLASMNVGAYVEVTFTARINDNVLPGQVITNTASADWTSLPGTGTPLGPDNPTGSTTPGAPGSTTGERTPPGSVPNDYRASDPADVTVITVAPEKTVVATSVAATDVVGNPHQFVTIGEIVRYRLRVRIPETNNLPLFEIIDQLPAGMLFLNDGTTRIAFISDGAGNIVSSNGAIGSGGGNSSDPNFTPTFTLDASAISALGGGMFLSGTDIVFSLGTISNADRDSNAEYVVIEFNALVLNDVDNQAGDDLVNDFLVRINNTQVGPNSNTTTNTIVEPNLARDKRAIATTGSVVTYEVTLTNNGTSTAYDAVLRDLLPAAQLDLILGSISVFSTTGGATSGTANHDDGLNRVEFNDITIPVGGSITIRYQANVLVLTAAGTTIDNTVNITYDSLDGDGTTGSNPTGSNVPGGSGTPTGERNGSGGVNDYFTSDTERLGSIGDTVWVDADASGTQNGTEPGIPNVPVTVRWAGVDGIFDNGDDSVITVLTNSAGQYFVGGLPISSSGYRVSVDTTAAVFATFGLNTQTFDADGTGTANRSLVTLTTGTPNPRNQDFGYRGTASLGDRVWHDLDADGVQDAGEPGIPSVGITAVWLGFDGAVGGGDDITYTTTTNASGNYTIPNLPAGNFVVSVNTATLPDNAIQTFDLNGALDHSATRTLTTGENATNVDFGYRGNASLGDRVWYDVDGDGVQDNTAGDGFEPGIAGVTITVTFGGDDGNLATTADNITYTTVTGANGIYGFDNLFGGDFLDGTSPNYQVVVTPPTGYPTQTFDADGLGTANQSSLRLDINDDNVLQDFGYRGPGTQALGNFVWHDLNGNGRQDGGSEVGIAGITVELLDSTGTVIDVTTTNGSGLYSFANLAASSVFGAYRVRFGNTVGLTTYTRTAQDSVVATDFTDSDGSVATGTTGDINLGANTIDNTRDQGLYLLQDIGDRVWYDVDNDGNQEAGEPGVNGVTVTLDYAGLDGVFSTADDQLGVATTTTSGDGDYLFADRIPGTYRTRTSGIPFGLTNQTYDLDGLGTANAAIAALTSGADRLDLDFGYRGTGSLGDRIWHDRDADGVQDAGEPGIPAVVVNVTWLGFDGTAGGGDDVNYTATTDANGNYTIPNLPAGAFVVTVDTATLPDNAIQTFDLNGGLDHSATRTLGIGENATDVDFGYRGNATIGDRVWYDVDGDGVQDNTAGDGFEPGIPGATVTLTFGGDDGDLATTGDNITYTTVTGANGIYQFANLFGGDLNGGDPNYTVVVTPPTGYPTQTFDNDGLGTPNQSSLQLGDNASNQLQDFGYRGPATQGLGNFVWEDVNGNGIQESGELGLAGVRVELLDAAGNILDVTTTGAGGAYAFNNLAASSVFGSYRVQFGNTDGLRNFGYTTQDSGATTDALDSDGHEVTGRTGNVSVPVGAFNDAVDQGLYQLLNIGDFVWYDIDNGGDFDAGEVPLPGVTMILDYAGFDGIWGTGDDQIGVATDVTDANGEYLFIDRVRGNYRVRVSTPSLPPGVDVPTFDLDGTGTADQAEFNVVVGTDRLDVDFAYRGIGSIGDRIFLDFNQNGVFDTGEGIANVDVTLTVDLNNDGVDEVLTTTTGADGFYQFTNLPAPPAGKSFVVDVVQATLPRDSDGSPLDNTVDPDGGFNSTSQVTLTLAAPNNPDQDFGYRGDGSIGDRVFLDTDGSGAWNTGEGINGVTVTISGDFDADGVSETYTTVTGPDGYYNFPGLPVRDRNNDPIAYTITVNQADLPSGVTNTVDPDGGTPHTAVQIIPDAAPNVVTVDFGYAGVGTIGDLVWVDSNANGVQDPGEGGITGVRMYLEADVNGDGTLERFQTLTNGLGYYQFINLPVRDKNGEVIEYRVIVDTTTLPLDVANVTDPDTLTLPTIGVFGDNESRLTLPDPTLAVPRPANLDQDFGYRLPGVIGDTVFLDINNNGLPDLGEGLGGVTVRLSADVNGDGLNESFEVTTDPNGRYQFTGLPFRRSNGSFIDYTVIVDPNGNTLPPGVAPSTDPDAGTPDGRSTIQLTADMPINLLQDFGYRGAKAITGSVYIDFTFDGHRQAFETGIPNQLITLTYNADNDPDFETVIVRTDNQGNYSFSGLPAYAVDGTLIRYLVIQVTQPVQFSDWLDETRGVVDPRSSGRLRTQSDVLLPISFEPGTPDVATTNDFGEVTFPDPPTTPVPVLTTTPLQLVPRPEINQGGDEEYIRRPFELFDVNDRLGHDTPYFSGVAGVVYDDRNNNGVQDKAEPGIAGVEIRLEGPTNRSTSTDKDGNFSFDQIPVGMYSIFERQPRGFLQGRLSQGSNGGKIGDDSFTGIGISAGKKAVDYTFGEIEPARIEGTAFVDIDGDGKQDSIFEIGLPGVLMLLDGTDDQGRSVHTFTFSWFDGSYSFEGLRPGDYKVAQLRPTMFGSSAGSSGSHGGEANGTSVNNVQLGPGDSGEGYDFAEQNHPLIDLIRPTVDVIKSGLQQAYQDLFGTEGLTRKPGSEAPKTGRLDAIGDDFWSELDPQATSIASVSSATEGGDWSEAAAAALFAATSLAALPRRSREKDGRRQGNIGRN